MVKVIKAVKPVPKENCCGKQIKRTERKPIVYKKTVRRKK
jgi:hypothetical protein